MDQVMAWFETGVDETAQQMQRAFGEVARKTREEILAGRLWE
jgi:hypothetical protein